MKKKKKKRLVAIIRIFSFLLFVLAFVFFLLGIKSPITGWAISDSGVECNIADLNADGKVDYLDKVVFNRFYEQNYKKDYYCGIIDLNEDNKINILDSNMYSVIFQKNYGNHVSPCNLRKPECESTEKKPEETKTEENQTERMGGSYISSFDSQNESKKLEIPKKENNLFWLLIIGIVLICLVIIFIYFSKRAKRSSNLNLKQPGSDQLYVSNNINIS